MGAQARAGIVGGPCDPKWMGAGLPSAPRWHSPYGEDPPARYMGRLWKVTGDGHVLRIEASWSKAEHLQSCLGPSRDVVAMVERRGSELVWIVHRTSGGYGVLASGRSDHLVLGEWGGGGGQTPSTLPSGIGMHGGPLGSMGGDIDPSRTVALAERVVATMVVYLAIRKRGYL